MTDIFEWLNKLPSCSKTLKRNREASKASSSLYICEADEGELEWAAQRRLHLVPPTPSQSSGSHQTRLCRRRGRGKMNNINIFSHSTPQKRRRVTTSECDCCRTNRLEQNHVQSCGIGGSQDAVAHLDSTTLDLDQTPIASRMSAEHRSITSQSSFYASSNTESASRYSRGSASARSSPTKQLQRMDIAERDPVIPLQIDLTDSRLPKALKKVLRELERYHNGDGVVPHELKNDIDAIRLAKRKTESSFGAVENMNFAYSSEGEEEEDGEVNDLFYNFEPRVYGKPKSDSSNHTTQWPAISPEAVLDIYTAAKQCKNEFLSEPAWNIMAHYPVFKLALGTNGTLISYPGVKKAERRPQRNGTSTISGGDDTTTAPIAASPSKTFQFPGVDTVLSTSTSCRAVRVCALPCSTARIYGRKSGTKMIDFCLAFAISNNDPNTKATLNCIESLRNRTPGYSVNHTDDGPLRKYPLALSAESKSPGGNGVEAELQVGCWQAAQWTLLENQKAEARRIRALEHGQPGTPLTGHTGIDKDEAGLGIPFLPALKIEGHNWSFVATTRHESKTVCRPLPMSDVGYMLNIRYSCSGTSKQLGLPTIH